MDRKKFITSTAFGIGALSVFPTITACKSDTKSETTSGVSQPEPMVIELQKPKIVRYTEGRTLNVLGDQQNIKLTGKDTNGSYTLIEQTNEPGIGIPPHVHQNEDEVFQVLEGQVEMTIGAQKTVLTAGDVIFCPRGVPHSWTVIGEQTSRAMLSIFPSGLEDMFEELSQLPAGPPDFEQVAAICGKYNLQFV